MAHSAARPGSSVTNPLLRAWWLETVNRVRAKATSRRDTIRWLAAIASVLTAAILILPLAADFWSRVVHLLASHVTTVSVLAAFQAWLWVHHSRRKWTEVYAHHWLSTAPMTSRAVLGVIALRSMLWPLALTMLLGLMMLISCALAPGLRGLIIPLAWCCESATLVGALLGWVVPRRMTRLSPIPTTTAASQDHTRASLSALSRWPELQTRVWLPPRTTARLVLPAAFLLPLDVSGNVAVALLCLWTLSLYLVALLRAIVVVAEHGASWLRSTPLPFTRFAWSMVRRSLLRQLQWTLFVACLLVALGCRPMMAIAAAEWWLALVSLTSTIALAGAHRRRAIGLKLTLSVCTVALVGRFRHYLVLPCALLISLWQIRKECVRD